MRKFFTVLVIVLCSSNTSFALSLELSDVIKEAREAEKIKLTQQQTQENSIQPIGNTSKQNLQKQIEFNPKEDKKN